MTRIIRSLRILGLGEEARAFYNVIIQAEMVNQKSQMYWTRAIRRPLNMAPKDEHTDSKRDKCLGPKFLQDFEEEKMRLVRPWKKIMQHLLTKVYEIARVCFAEQWHSFSCKVFNQVAFCQIFLLTCTYNFSSLKLVSCTCACLGGDKWRAF